MHAKMVAPWVLLMITVLISSGGCALQQDLVVLNDRVIALEQKVSKAEADRASLRSEVAHYHEDQLNADEAWRSRHAELHALVNDIRDEMRQLRGELEKGQYNARKGILGLAELKGRREEHWKSLEKSVQNSLDRIVRIEQYLGMEPSEKLVSSDTDITGTKKEQHAVAETPEDLYARAKQCFDQGEYEDARELFRSFLKQYPKSNQADNAQFWLGEIYYREKWYEKAILEYQKVIENYPKGNKTLSALLKQGFAFLNLGDKANARLILKELIRKYPDSNEANIAKKKLKMLK
ncbi:MAG: tol-pal system protein YbgF [Deltaproteobacteria bacterium]|nr:tol-pal system protein YbgF [Deltaproteobacteria bacterium]MBW2073914.1 tol-pal system protein YbgF [Deltaproteobacteria bacterium]